VVEATGVTAVGNICLPLTRNGGTVLVYGLTRPDERLSVSPFEIFAALRGSRAPYRREITIKCSYAEMTSFGAAIAALRTGRVRMH
jgi:D-arabinitol dehydrogenase (NADP+)